MSAVSEQFDAKVFVDSLPGRPGVYRMLDSDGQILYVGKARNLKSRVASYFQPSNVQPKVQALIAKTANMEVTITNSDTEALLLEYNLIKKHRPRFNVVLRDDKSFPYLHLETNHEYPRLNFYRGSRNLPPAPSATHCSSCRSYFASAIAMTLILRTAHGPVCSIRSNAARRPVWVWSPRSTMRAM
jgi:excinuclease UvrABC nuclease subunit